MNYTKTEIQQIFLNKAGRLNSILLKRKGGKQNNLIYEWITQQKSFTDNISEKIYCLLYDIDEPRKCPICGDKLKFWMFKYGYHKTCNKSICIRTFNPNWKSCSNAKIVNQKNYKLTFFNNYFKNKKALKINNEEVVNFIKERVKVTQYGLKGSWIICYNTKHETVLHAILKLTEEYIPLNTAKPNWAERFYNIYYKYPKHKCIICKKETPFINFKRGYQTTCSANCSNKGYAGVKRRDNHFENILLNINKNYEIIPQNNYMGLNKSDLHIKCKSCNKSFYKTCSSGKWKRIKCPYCMSTTSNYEQEIYMFLKNIGVDGIIRNDRKTIHPLELDFYIPSKNIAIEFNGNYWHTEENGKDQYYHINKTNLCKKLGINLIQIFSDEWENNKNNIKRKLRDILAPKTINCITIDIIEQKQKNNFLSANGFANKRSTINYGLFFKQKIIGVVLFKRKQNNIWDIVGLYNTPKNI